MVAIRGSVVASLGQGPELPAGGIKIPQAVLAAGAPVEWGRGKCNWSFRRGDGKNVNTIGYGCSMAADVRSEAAAGQQTVDGWAGEGPYLRQCRRA
ncbi:hypothetical protein HPP92_018551 [Vanilla planifolia]|uniref:Uncharacterized protein n=1 Tax=Vanilla planifolia TaxID=51239 RepID=A0A835Q730_VANPL|nr:hypothetical protein HPP92_019165 [Vanilla planifolia]KAG0469223.1 hypothetical protein HPP92_018551 [Vanilla planifolia]